MRERFEKPQFRKGVTSMKDLKVGQKLSGKNKVKNE
jgi:transcriptional accessory protein Tex/SPT6